MVFISCWAFAWSGLADPPLPRELEPYFSAPPSLRGDYGNYRSPLAFDNGSRVTTSEQWSQRRAEILESWMRHLGHWPELLKEPQAKILETQSKADFDQTLVQLQTSPHTVQRAWLLTPHGSSKHPAVLVVYYEPETSIGASEQKHRDFAIQLAKRGFVTFSIGTPGGDARKPDFGKRFGQPLSQYAYIAANCWTYLSRLPNVDKERIGITGHSYGGKWALFGAGLWEKFACVAVSDPGIVFDESRPSVNYWEPWYLGYEEGREQRNPGTISSERPRTGAYKILVEEGRDLHELHALLAPRPFLVSGGSEDPVSRWQALNHLVQVNEVLGFRSRVGMTNRPVHDPDDESNAVLYRFFEHFLKSR